MSRSRPEVVAFDVNETLLDLAPVRAALVEAGQPETLLPTVFTRTPCRPSRWPIAAAMRLTYAPSGTSGLEAVATPPALNSS